MFVKWVFGRFKGGYQTAIRKPRCALRASFHGVSFSWSKHREKRAHACARVHVGQKRRTKTRRFDVQNRCRERPGHPKSHPEAFIGKTRKRCSTLIDFYLQTRAGRSERKCVPLLAKGERAPLGRPCRMKKHRFVRKSHINLYHFSAHHLDVRTPELSKNM